MRRPMQQRWRLLALGVGSVLVLSVGIAYAAIPDASGVINGCYVSGQGQLRVIDKDKGETCKNNETAISWNQKGPKGDKGDKGDTGPQGPRARRARSARRGPQGRRARPARRGSRARQAPTGAPGAQGGQGRAGPPGPQGRRPGRLDHVHGQGVQPNGIFCFEISDQGVFITRAGHKVVQVTLDSVDTGG